MKYITRYGSTVTQKCRCCYTLYESDIKDWREDDYYEPHSQCPLCGTCNGMDEVISPFKKWMILGWRLLIHGTHVVEEKDGDSE